MTNKLEEKIVLEASVGDERRSPGTVIVHPLSKTEKLIKACKKLGLFWALAVFSVLVPVLHFFLVPLFLVLGIYLALRSYKSLGQVVSGETRCPHCQSEIHIKPGDLQWPLTEICQTCARVVRMLRSSL